MSYCLFCHERITPKVSWSSFLQIADPLICFKCKNSLEKISGDTCAICSRPFKTISVDYRINNVCSDCARWEKDPNWRGVLSKNKSIFVYNDFLKEVLSTFKFRGDYEIVKAFQLDFQKIFKQTFDQYLIVPIPLSPERLYERGFNQAAALAELIDRPVYTALTRTDQKKQSKKSRKERITSNSPFQLHPTPEIENKQIVLIDDIYTTGITVRQAAKMLITEGKTKSVAALTLARG